MKIKFPIPWIKELPEEIRQKSHNRFLRDQYGAKNDMIELDFTEFDLELTEVFIKIAETNSEIKDGKRKYVLGQLRLLHEMQTSPNVENITISELKHIGPAMTKWATKVDQHIFFKEMHGIYQPMVYLGFEVSEKGAQRAYVCLLFGYLFESKLESVKIYFYQEDIQKKTTPANLLMSKNVFPSSDALFAQYELDKVDFFAKKDLLGRQVLGTGTARRADRDYYSRQDLVLDYYNEPGKLVIDDPSDLVTSMLIELKWLLTDDKDKIVFLPLALFIKCYHLQKYQYVYAYTSSIILYQFNKELSGKLVLEEDMDKLINILQAGTKLQLADIISGKTGGMFVLCTGDPGTGKTLTAEVFAESTERALYIVQCSQLGISPDKIEERLKDALKKAERWDAVLLIDEADVYIRERGRDFVHNAVVGVFLRVLESYQGIIFMTSNVSSIDDAIISRSLCHIKFPRPSMNELYRIWLIMSEQYQLNLTSDDVESLMWYAPNLVGRDVKQICRLIRFLSLGDETQSLSELILRAFKFRGLELDPSKRVEPAAPRNLYLELVAKEPIITI